MLVIAASSNKGKLKELNRILMPYEISVVSMGDMGIDVEIVENGTTFQENALIKARAIHKITGKPVISDDSGLCVNCLDGKPGVYSARYAGEETPYNEKIATLLQEIDATGSSDRSAYFATVIAFIDKDSTEYVFEGRCEGNIGYKPSGGNGFGYDPIFYVEKGSFAEISDEEKDRISHRGVALKKLTDSLDKIIK